MDEGRKIDGAAKAVCRFLSDNPERHGGRQARRIFRKHANQIGPRNMKIPEIRKAITSRLKQLEDGRIANVREVMERVTSIARNELTEEVVVTEGQGRGKSRARVITKDVPIHDRLGALRILLFLYGLDRPAGKEERGTVTIVDDVRGSGQDEKGN